ncbi:MAG: hypothetical protein V2A34_10125 [Lentisphaerota bacterium]
MKKTMVCAMLAGVALSASAENLLKNPAFNEMDQNAGGLAGYPASWQVFGTANRCNWRSHGEGKWCIGVCGQWADIGMDGSIVQSGIPVVEGKTYNLVPFFWADPEWFPTKQYMRIAFFGVDAGAELAVEEATFDGILPVWSNISLSAVAPTGAVTASVSIGVKGVSIRGGLSIDDVYFGESPD